MAGVCTRVWEGEGGPCGARPPMPCSPMRLSRRGGGSAWVQGGEGRVPGGRPVARSSVPIDVRARTPQPPPHLPTPAQVFGNEALEADNFLDVSGEGLCVCVGGGGWGGLHGAAAPSGCDSTPHRPCQHVHLAPPRAPPPTHHQPLSNAPPPHAPTGDRRVPGGGLPNVSLHERA